MPADHEVEVTLDTIGGVQEAVPHLNGHNPMHRPKSVHYFTRVPGATVRIEFVANPAEPDASILSPFVDVNGREITVVRSTDPPLPLKNAGDFLCRCFLESPSAKEIGWGPDTPNSGGNHIVR